ncbi:MAG: hypothetical protein KDA25_07555, partial [Phycisphaerales bacterium]|nr:hypothetical protein [Phycisphaerales bacterium]
PDATDPGEIRMMIGPGGYVGVTRVEDGHLTIGAAIDPRRTPAAETARDVVVRIVRPHRPGLADALAGASPDEWFGAPPLARRRPCLATTRVLVIGDAAGYVEPFTGEGMAWALDAGRRAAILVAGGWRASLLADWPRDHARHVRRRQRWCGALRSVLHRPRLASAALWLGGGCPGVIDGAIRAIAASPPAVRAVSP